MAFNTDEEIVDAGYVLQRDNLLPLLNSPACESVRDETLEERFKQVTSYINQRIE